MFGELFMIIWVASVINITVIEPHLEMLENQNGLTAEKWCHDNKNECINYTHDVQHIFELSSKK